MLLTTFTPLLGSVVQAEESLEDLIEQKENAENRSNELGSVIAETDEEMNRLEQERQELEASIQALQISIQKLTEDLDRQNQRLDETNEEIERLNIEIEELNKAIEMRHEKLMTQARATQTKWNPTNVIHMIISSEDISDLISRVGIVSKLVSANQQIIEDQRRDQEAVVKAEAQVQIEKQEVETLVAQIEANREELTVQQVELDNEIMFVAERYQMNAAEKDQFVSEQFELAEKTMALSSEIQAEEERIAEEKRLEEERRIAEEKRLEEERIAEEKRLEEERRIAEEKRLEEERIAEEERQRQAEEEAAALAAEQRRQEEEEKAVAAERNAAEKRRAEEEKASAQRSAAEQRAAEKRQEEERQARQEAERVAQAEAAARAEANARAAAAARAEAQAAADRREAERKAAAAKAAEEAKTSSNTAPSKPAPAPAPAPVSSGWLRPASGYISSSYGYRTHPVTGQRSSFHNGIDIAGGGPIRASRAGRVTAASYSGTYGYRVIVDHGNGYSTLYAHMQPGLSVSVGQNVSQGQQLGIMGTTGRSTGVHLHFEVRQNGRTVNPMNFIR